MPRSNNAAKMDMAMKEKDMAKTEMTMHDMM